MSEVLVIGSGSIGTRHARVARDDGHSVTVVSRRGGFPGSGAVTDLLESTGVKSVIT